MINKEEIEHIAKLARIKLSQEELEKFRSDLSSILDFFAALKEINVSGIEPAFHPTENFLNRAQNKELGPFSKEKINTIREDKARPQTAEVIDKMIEAFPEKKDNYIKVRAVF